MGKFLNDSSARCTLCSTFLTMQGLARNDRHLYPIGSLYACDCGRTKVWTNSIRNEKALLAHYATGSRYFQGFCNDLFDGEGREIMPWRSVAFPGEYQRGQIYGTYEDYKLFEAGQGPDSTLVVWSGRFWPEVEGAEELIAHYAPYAEQIRALLAAPRSNPRQEPHIVAAQERTPDSEAFRRWFRNSKVVDETGKPLIVWHAQSETAEAFTVFDFARALDVGMHFGTKGAALQVIDYEEPSEHGRLVRPFYLSIQNPLMMEDPTAWVTVPIAPNSTQPVLQQLEDMGLITAPEHLALNRKIIRLCQHTPLDQVPEVPGKISQLVRELLEGLGYDGIVYRNEAEDTGSVSWIAFRPTQIKVADGANTTFDPANPDVRMNPAGHRRRRHAPR